MEINSPSNWNKSTIKELLQFVIGGDWGKSPDYNNSEYEFAYCIRGSEFKNWEEDRGKTASLRKIKKSGLEKRILKEGDILLEISGGGPDQPVGRTVLIDKVALSFEPKISKICTNFLRLLRPVDKINSKYLDLYLKFFYKSGEIIKYQGGSNNLRNLKYREFETISIPYPEFLIQTNIVSKIEELFSELDNGIKQLKTAKEQLKVYRQSVLKWAFEGKLTTKNVINGELPKGWKDVKIGDACYNVEYGSSSKSQKEGKIPVLRMGNIQNGKFDFSDLVFTDDEKEIEKYLLQKNDVLFNRTNSAELVGKTAIFKNERPSVFAGYLIRINRIENLLDGDYLCYYLNSKKAKAYGNSVRTFGVNQSNINGQKLKGYPLPLPPLEEQIEIVQEIESRLSVCDKVEETIETALKQSESLRQCILKKAFEGKLI